MDSKECSCVCENDCVVNEVKKTIHFIEENTCRIESEVDINTRVVDESTKKIIEAMEKNTEKITKAIEALTQAILELKDKGEKLS